MRPPRSDNDCKIKRRRQEILLLHPPIHHSIFKLTYHYRCRKFIHSCVFNISRYNNLCRTFLLLSIKTFKFVTKTNFNSYKYDTFCTLLDQLFLSSEFLKHSILRGIFKLVIGTGHFIWTECWRLYKIDVTNYNFKIMSTSIKVSYYRRSEGMLEGLPVYYIL